MLKEWANYQIESFKIMVITHFKKNNSFFQTKQEKIFFKIAISEQ